MQTSSRFLVALVALVLIAMPHAVQGQVTSNQAQVQLNAAGFPESLTLTVPSNAINFVIHEHAAANGDNPLTVQVDYNIDPSSPRDLTLYLYFADPVALTGPGGTTINNSQIGIIEAGATGGSPFVMPTPFSGPTGRVYPLGSFSGSGSALNSYELQINALGGNYSPGPFTGTLFVQAQAI